MELNEYKTDEKLEVEGTWIDYGDDGKFLIARLGNHKFNERHEALRKKYKGKLSNKQQKEITIQAMAETIFLGFEGITENGIPLEDTLENRKKILSVRDVSDWIVEASRDMENFKAEQEKEDLKNFEEL